MGSHLVDEFPHGVLCLGPEILGSRFQVLETEGGSECQGVRVADLDGAESHLDDVVSLVIGEYLELIPATVEDVVEGLLDDGLVGGGEELLGLVLGSQEDGTRLPGDGVDSKVLCEGHPGDRVLDYLLGGEGGGGDERNRKGDETFHMSVDFSVLHRSDFIGGVGTVIGASLPPVGNDRLGLFQGDVLLDYSVIVVVEVFDDFIHIVS